MQDNNPAHEHTVFRQTEAQFILRGVSGITFAKNFTLVGKMIIGRTKDCDITIPSNEISRHHACIITRPGSILLEDLGSSNGTFVNNKPINKAVIHVGDEIRFDKIRFQIQSVNQVDELLGEPRKIENESVSINSAPVYNKTKIAIALLTAVSAIAITSYFLM